MPLSFDVHSCFTLNFHIRSATTLLRFYPVCTSDVSDQSLEAFGCHTRIRIEAKQPGSVDNAFRRVSLSYSQVSRSTIN